MNTANIRLVFLLFLLLTGAAAEAHKASDSYLRLRVQDAQVQGQWDIALRDLQAVLPLDADGDAAITWGELRARHAAIADYALARLTLTGTDGPCTVTAQDQRVDRHTDGTYTVLSFIADCKAPPRALEIGYRLFFDIDRQHRGLLQLDAADSVRSAVFSPAQAEQSFQAGASDRYRQFIDYLREGVWHIAIGYDHILFLVALLLPVVLQRQPVGWQPVARLRTAVAETLKIVTAFTLAHSLTLSLAATGTLQLPSRWVESAIAASVLLAALDNMVPLFRCPRWWVSFGFGLVHGFGFATVLGELGLAQGNLLLSLLAFNLGVEAGQLLIVASLLPVLYGLSRSPHYPRTVLGRGSLASAGLALIWLIERAGNITLWTVR